MHNQLVRRPKVAPTTRLCAMIAKGICLHYDIELYWNNAEQRYYMTLLLSKGGRDIIQIVIYRVDLDARKLYVWDDDTCLPGRVVDATLTSPGVTQRGHYDALNEIHWKEVVPKIDMAFVTLQPQGYRYKSVNLAYVECPSVDCIAPDMVNTYTPGRGRRTDLGFERFRGIL